VAEKAKHRHLAGCGTQPHAVDGEPRRLTVIVPQTWPDGQMPGAQLEPPAGPMKVQATWRGGLHSPGPVGGKHVVFAGHAVKSPSLQVTTMHR